VSVLCHDAHTDCRSKFCYGKLLQQGDDLGHHLATTDQSDASKVGQVLAGLWWGAECPEFVALLHLCQEGAPSIIRDGGELGRSFLTVCAGSGSATVFLKQMAAAGAAIASSIVTRLCSMSREEVMATVSTHRGTVIITTATARPAVSMKPPPATIRARRNSIAVFS
jgi:hypothetical protein